jgi:hypothetical protein
MQAYGYQQQQQQQNALQAYLQQNAQAIMAGDQNALAGLAQFDPQTAMSIAGDQQTMKLRSKADRRAGVESQASLADQAERLKLAQAEAKAQMDEHAVTMSAAQRAEAADKIEAIAADATQIDSAEEWDAHFKSLGPEFKELIGKFGEKKFYEAKALGTLESLRGQGGADTAEIQNLKFRADQAGLKEGTPEYQNFMANGGVPKGMSLRVGADNSVEFSDGPLGSGPGGMMPKAPPGVANVPQPDGTITQAPIAGGTQTQMPAELAARVGLAKDSLDRLPGLIDQAKAGDLTGAWDYLMGVAGRGKQGEAKRDTAAASEAITRLLTGAGMNNTEIAREKDMYKIQAWDNADTVANKLEQLQRRLTVLTEQAERGRGEGVAVDPNTGLGIAPPPGVSDDDMFKKYGVPF